MAMKKQWRDFLASLSGKSVTLCGIGVSNLPLMDIFQQAGASVTVRDRRTREKLGEAGTLAEKLRIPMILGDSYLDHLTGDLILRSPGIPFHTPSLEQARKAGIPVTSEMELFFEYCPCHLIGVSGSDGKTTTTTLVSELLKAQGKKVWLGGNIGTPLLPEIELMQPDDYAVVELSSFQLISMRKSPDVAVLTNISPNHLDIHKDMQEYIDAKTNLFIHQNAFSRTVLNAENEITHSFLPLVRGYAMEFSDRKRPEQGVYIENGMVTVSVGGQRVPVVSVSDIRLPGAHNVQNYMAAIAAVWGTVDAENIRKTAKEFAGVEHRIEFVRELNGVRWYNDSIATSPTRAIAGLNAFDQKMIIIAGGYDKHIPFDPFAKKAIEKIKLLILTGDTSDAIENCIRKQPEYRPGQPEIIRAADLKEAVFIAGQRAENGDVVSLSPACASFDRYPNFAVRGDEFKKLVKALS